MECYHIQDPGVPKHTLPCRHVFCLDCTREIEGLMEDRLFACPTCGNYSQYVDAVQTVEGRSETVATDCHKVEERDEPRQVDPPAESQSYDERSKEGDHQQLDQYNRGANTSFSSARDISSPSPQQMEAADVGEALKRYDTSLPTRALKEQAARWQEFGADNSVGLHTQQQRQDESLDKYKCEQLTREYGRLGIDEGNAICQYHSTYKCEYFCSKCEEMICKQCSWGSHRLHETVPLGDSKESDEVQKSREYIERQQQERLAKCSNEKTFAGEFEGGQPAGINTNDIFCKSHPNSEVFFFCTACDIPVCTHCTKKEHKNHSTVQLQEGPTAERQCRVHGLPLMVYCKKCMKEICIECQNRYHNGYHNGTFHSVITIEQAKNDFVLLFDELNNEIQYVKGKFDDENKSTESKVDSILREADDLKKKVERETKNAIAKLNSNAETMITSIDRHTQKCVDACTKHTSQLVEDVKHRVDDSEIEITNGKQLIEGNELAKAKVCANKVEKEITYLRKHKVTPPLKTELQCHTNIIPGSTNNNAPVYLSESKTYAQRFTSAGVSMAYHWK